jgi:hypothetical protein
MKRAEDVSGAIDENQLFAFRSHQSKLSDTVLKAKASRSSPCHPDEASNASGRNWLLASGQLRASEAGTGFEIAQRSFAEVRHGSVLTVSRGVFN